MQVIELKDLVRTAKGVTEQDVREAGELIRRVEELGATRSQYNLASPYSRTPRPADPRTVSKKSRR